MDPLQPDHDPTVLVMFIGGAILVVIAVVFTALYGSRKRREAIKRESEAGDE